MPRANGDHGQRAWLAIIAVILLMTAAYFASSVFAPLALAFFIMAMVWPMQHWLETRVPKLLALTISVLTAIAACILFAGLVAWGFGRVARSLIADAAYYQSLYDEVVRWLETQGISIAGVWAEHFNVRWMLRTAHDITGRVNTTLTFWLIAFCYVLLGLLEVGDMRAKLMAMDNREAARVILNGTIAVSRKIRKYMWVRTQMSILTGVLVWLFAWAVDLQFAAEWGVIAFALNYIPFIGPFVATFFPTALALADFASWQMALGVFIGLNIIQFVVGNYVEPRVSGTVLSLSPTLVVFAVFLGAFIWGLFGAFIGVPIAIAIIAYCEEHPSTHWVATLLGSPPKETG